VQPVPGEPIRVNLPHGKQVLGVVIGLMGASRMRTTCKDGKERMCRIPGRMKNKVWVKEGDVVIVEPHEIEGDKKGDIVWRYNPLQAKWLKEHGHIN
jgi:translation initiation factor 1A